MWDKTDKIVPFKCPKQRNTEDFVRRQRVINQLVSE